MSTSMTILGCAIAVISYVFFVRMEQHPPEFQRQAMVKATIMWAGAVLVWMCRFQTVTIPASENRPSGVLIINRITGHRTFSGQGVEIDVEYRSGTAR